MSEGSPKKTIAQEEAIREKAIASMERPPYTPEQLVEQLERIADALEKIAAVLTSTKPDTNVVKVYKV